MQELLVLSNPRRRRKHGKKARRRSRRSARKMSALQRKYFGKRSTRRTRRNVSVLANPAPRKRRYRRSMRARMRRAGRRAQRGFLRIGGGTGSLARPFSMIGPALTGALGAVTVQTVISRLPLPAILNTGKVRFLTQGAVAIGLGTVASRFGFIGSSVAAKMAEGALTVILADAIKELASDAGFNLGGMGYYLPGRVALNVPANAGSPAARLGKYVTGPGSVVPMRSRMGNINTFKF